MFSQTIIDNKSDKELIDLIQRIAGEVETSLNDVEEAHDYANSLSILVDNLRERLSKQCDELYAD